MWKSSTCLEWVVINFTFRIRMLNPTKRNLKWASCSVFVIGLKQWSPDIDWNTLSCVVFLATFWSCMLFYVNLKNTEYSIFTQEVGFKFFLFMMHVLNKCFKVDLILSLFWGRGLDFKDLIVVISKKTF